MTGIDNARRRRCVAFRCLGLLAMAALSVSSAGATPELAVQSGHGRPVESLSLSADGRWLASVAQGGAVKLWDLQSQLLVRNISRRTGAVVGGGG